MIAEVSSQPRGLSIIPFVQCAWCGRINLRGRYCRLPGVGRMVRRYSFSIPLVARLDVSVSHGICPSCANDVYATAGRR